MSVIARLFRNGNLKIAGQLITTEPGIDSTELIDDTYLIDDTHIFNDTDDISIFIAYLFDLIILETNINYFKINSKGNLLVSKLNESKSKISIGSDYSLTLTGTLSQNFIF